MVLFLLETKDVLNMQLNPDTGKLVVVAGSFSGFSQKKKNLEKTQFYFNRHYRLYHLLCQHFRPVCERDDLHASLFLQHQKVAECSQGPFSQHAKADYAVNNAR